MAVLKPILRSPLAGLCLAIFALCCGLENRASAQSASKEYQVKAAFLFNFAQFVEWPTAAPTNAGASFSIGVLGDDPFGAALEETVQGESIDGHKIVIQHARTLKDLKDCRVIFICKSEKSNLKSIITELDSSAVLTVSEINGFTQDGGIINFYLEGSKVRFEINASVARRDGLKVSSQLLSLGKIVPDGKGGG